jgi:hypothetical protein
VIEKLIHHQKSQIAGHEWFWRVKSWRQSQMAGHEWFLATEELTPISNHK